MTTIALDTKFLKIQMLAATIAVYVINTLVILMLKGGPGFDTLFAGVDFIAVFQLGLVFGLACIIGYIYVPSVKLKQTFNIGFMLPLTGTSMITIAVVYFLQQLMPSTLGMWMLIGLLLALLAFSFGTVYRIAEFTKRQPIAV